MNPSTLSLQKSLLPNDLLGLRQQALGDIGDVGKPGEMLITGYQGHLAAERCRVDQGIGEGKTMCQRKIRCVECHRAGQWNDLGLLGHGHDLQRRFLVALRLGLLKQ